MAHLARDNVQWCLDWLHSSQISPRLLHISLTMKLLIPMVRVNELLLKLFLWVMFRSSNNQTFVFSDWKRIYIFVFHCYANFIFYIILFVSGEWASFEVVSVSDVPPSVPQTTKPLFFSDCENGYTFLFFITMLTSSFTSFFLYRFTLSLSLSNNSDM